MQVIRDIKGIQLKVESGINKKAVTYADNLLVARFSQFSGRVTELLKPNFINVKISSPTNT